MITNCRYFLLLLLVLVGYSTETWADTTYVHRLEADVVPSGVIQNNNYLRGNNPQGENINTSTTLRLKYTLQQAGNPSAIGAYAGFGVGTVLTSSQLGMPVLVYIAQGAPIINFSRHVSLNYELNLGIAAGWKAYESVINETNHVVGSRVMSYIGADVFFRFMLGRHWDLNVGYGYNLVAPHNWLFHFSFQPTMVLFSYNRIFYYDDTKDKSNDWSDILVTGRIAVVHYFNKRYFGGLTFNYNDSRTGDSDKILISNGKWKGRVILGMRL